MKKLTFIFLLLFPSIIFSQNLTGKWSWVSEDKSNTFELDLYEEDGIIEGRHCSVFYDGLKIDCVEKDEASSIQLTQFATGVFEGIIISGFSQNRGKIRLSFNESDNTISFKLLKEPENEYYIPTEVF